MKASVGMLLCGGIMYFFFRKNIKSLYNWSVIFLSAISFLIANYLMNSMDVYHTAAYELDLYHFTKIYLATPTLTPVHYLVYCGLTLTVLFLRLKNVSKIHDLLSFEKHIFEHILFLVCLVGMLPGLLIRIPGGSAAYFAELQVSLAVLLFLAYDYPNKVIEWFKEQVGLFGKLIASLVAYFICLSLLYNINFDMARSFMFNRAHRGETQNTIFPPSQHLSNPLIVYLNETEKVVKSSRQDYWIFIDETSILWEATHPIWIIRSFLGYTGVVLMNAIYIEGGQSFYRNDTVAGGEAFFYPSTPNPQNSYPHMPRMEFEELIRKARNSNINNIIHFFKDQMVLVNTEDY